MKLLILLAIALAFTSWQDLSAQSDSLIITDTLDFFPRQLEYYPSLSRDDTVSSIKNLRRDIDAILNSSGLKNTSFGVAIYSLDQDKYYYKRNEDLPLTPASITKLFTTFTIFQALGHDFKVKTTIYTDAKKYNYRDSVINGNLYIYGRGDAFLSTGDLRKIVSDIKRSGVRRINGNVYSDGSFFDSINVRMLYSNDKDHVVPLPPITALSIDGNTVTVNATLNQSGATFIYSIPPSDEFIIQGAQDKSKNKKSRSSLLDYQLNSNYTEDSSFEPSDNDVYLRYGDALPDPRRKKKNNNIIHSKKDGRQSFSFVGRLAQGKTHSEVFIIDNPVKVVGGTLYRILKDSNIVVNGKFGTAKMNDSIDHPFIVAEFARPINDIISKTNKTSDNYLAENLFKLIGGNFRVSNNTAEDAQKAERETFKKIGINFDKCVLNDGSGLSRRNLVTPQAVLGLLKSAYKNNNFKAFDTTLAIAGVDGTLRNRMQMTAAEGNLHGKTGTLRNASGLCGYIRTLDNELIAFAFIFNGSNVGLYKSIENSLGELVAQFFYFNEER